MVGRGGRIDRGVCRRIFIYSIAFLKEYHGSWVSEGSPSPYHPPRPPLPAAQIALDPVDAGLQVGKQNRDIG